MEDAEAPHPAHIHGQDHLVHRQVPEAAQALQQGPLEGRHMHRHAAGPLHRPDPIRQLRLGLGGEPQHMPAVGHRVRVQAGGGAERTVPGLGQEHPLGDLALFGRAEKGRLLTLEQEP